MKKRMENSESTLECYFTIQYGSLRKLLIYFLKWKGKYLCENYSEIVNKFKWYECGTGMNIFCEWGISAGVRWVINLI